MRWDELYKNLPHKKPKYFWSHWFHDVRKRDARAYDLVGLLKPKVKYVMFCKTCDVIWTK